MKVAFVCADPGVPVFGSKGSSIHAQEILRAFMRKGAEVEVFGLSVDGPRPPDLEALTVHALPFAPDGPTVADRERSLAALNVPLSVQLTARGPFDVLYERYSLWSSAGMDWARSEGVPGILEVNAPLPDEQARHRTLVDRLGAEGSARHAISAARAVVAVSDPVARWARRRSVDPARVHVIPNGVDPLRFPAPSLAFRAGEPFTVGFLGTLKPWHGVATLIDALSLLSAEATSCRLLVVGDGPEREALEARARESLGSQGARFVGAVSPDEVPAWLGRMDVATAPYGRHEGEYFSPLKLVEYLAAARPVVATRVPASESVIRHGVNGLLCEPDSPRDLAAAIDQLRRLRALARRLGVAGRRWVLETRTWDHALSRALCAADVA